MAASQSLEPCRRQRRRWSEGPRAPVGRMAGWPVRRLRLHEPSPGRAARMGVGGRRVRPRRGSCITTAAVELVATRQLRHQPRASSLMRLRALTRTRLHHTRPQRPRVRPRPRRMRQRTRHVLPPPMPSSLLSLEARCRAAQWTPHARCISPTSQPSAVHPPPRPQLPLHLPPHQRPSLQSRHPSLRHQRAPQLC